MRRLQRAAGEHHRAFNANERPQRDEHRAFELRENAAQLRARTPEVDFWGARAQLGSVLTQLKSTMLVTLWTFIGVEGAVVLSGRALKPAHIGVATFAGLAICAGLYVS